MCVCERECVGVTEEMGACVAVRDCALTVMLSYLGGRRRIKVCESVCVCGVFVCVFVCVW